MARLTMGDVRTFARALSRVSEAAVGEFRRICSTVEWGLFDPDETVEVLESIALYVVGKYGAASAALGADFYELCMQWKTGTAAAQAGDYAAAVASRAAAAAEQSGGDAALAAAKLEGAIDLLVKQGARDTVVRNGGDEVRFARVPTDDCCAWCRMMASRGYVYRSEETAGFRKGEFNRYHDFCNCAVVPEFGNGAIEGYDPAPYAEEYYGNIEYTLYGTVDREATLRNMRQSSGNPH